MLNCSQNSTLIVLLHLYLVLTLEHSCWNEDSPYHDKTRVYIFFFSLGDVVEIEEMIDANNIQVNLFCIYSPRKAFLKGKGKCALQELNVILYSLVIEICSAGKKSLKL